MPRSGRAALGGGGARTRAIADCRALIERHGLTQADLWTREFAIAQCRRLIAQHRLQPEDIVAEPVTRTTEPSAPCAAVPAGAPIAPRPDDARRSTRRASTPASMELPGHLTASRPSPDASHRHPTAQPLPEPTRAPVRLDTRFTVAPGQQFVGAGFRALGIGHYLDDVGGTHA